MYQVKKKETVKASGLLAKVSFESFGMPLSQEPATW